MVHLEEGRMNRRVVANILFSPLGNGQFLRYECRDGGSGSQYTYFFSLTLRSGTSATRFVAKMVPHSPKQTASFSYSPIQFCSLSPSSGINGLCRRRNAASAALKNIPSKAEAAATLQDDNGHHP